jgi:hypothetical protein
MKRDVDGRARVPTKTVGSHDVLLKAKRKTYVAQ